MKQEFSGRVVQVLIGKDPVSLVTSAQPEVAVTFAGFEGDKHAGLTRPADGRTPHYPRGTEIRNDRQVSIVCRAELAKVARQLGLPEIQPEWLGANLLFSGIPHLTLLPPGSRLFFEGGATLVVQAENLPCVGPGRILQEQFPAEPDLANRFPKAAQHRRGIVAWVEKPGQIRAGDQVVARLQNQPVFQIEEKI